MAIQTQPDESPPATPVDQQPPAHPEEAAISIGEEIFHRIMGQTINYISPLGIGLRVEERWKKEVKEGSRPCFKIILYAIENPEFRNLVFSPSGWNECERAMRVCVEKYNSIIDQPDDGFLQIARTVDISFSFKSLDQQ